MAMLRTYTETYDMNTEEGCPTLLGIHTPIGPTMYKFLSPAFKMYKKYKYLGCDVTVVNAARLPVDPEQVGKIEGTNYVDPRDTLNPIMFRGCHGESLAAVLDSMYNELLMDYKGPSVDHEKLKSDLQAFYYTALGDDGWRKSPIQKTLSLRGLHPMVYSVSTNHQILPTNGLAVNHYKAPIPIPNPGLVGDVDGAENGQVAGPDISHGWGSPLVGPTGVYNATGAEGIPSYVGGNLSMFTSKMHRLGWLDTMQYIGHNATDEAPGRTNEDNIALLPKCFMGLLMLPPSYLCRQYLRVIIRHKIKFAGYRSITTGAGSEDFSAEAYQGNYGYLYTGNESKGGNTPKPPPGYPDDEVYDREALEGDDPDE